MHAPSSHYRNEYDSPPPCEIERKRWKPSFVNGFRSGPDKVKPSFVNGWRGWNERNKKKD